MRKILFLLLGVSLVSAGEIELRAELLYWKPTTGGLNLGTVQLEGHDQVILLRPHHECGGTVEGRYWCNNLFAGAQYTHIDARDRRKVVKSIVPPFSQQVADEVQAKELVDLDVVEVKLGYQLYCAHQLRASIFGVIEAASTRTRAEIDYFQGEAVIDAIRERTRFRGIGPGVGIEGDFFLSCGLGLAGRIGTTLLIGEREFSFTEKLYPSDAVLVPTFNGRLAVAYRYRWVTAELGYEVRHYVDAFVRAICQSGSCVSELRDLTYGGPFFALTVTF